MSIPRFWRNIKSRYNLIATKCLSCGGTYFPPRNLCPRCRRKSKLKKVKLKGVGEVLTYTVIHSAPEGFENRVPYIMAIVKLEDGPCLTTQLVDCEPSEVKIGMKVKSVFRRIQEDGEAGLIHYGFKFKPLSGAEY
jgi:hypothetical protein